MSTVQWLLLIAILVFAVAVYFLFRRPSAGDPWRDMDEPEEAFDENAPGDSYVIGVRTLNHETPADRKAAASMRADRTSASTDDEASPVDRTRAVRAQPTTVRRRPAPPEPVAEPLLRRSSQVRASEFEMPRGLKLDPDDALPFADEAVEQRSVEPRRASPGQPSRSARPLRSAAADMVAPQPVPGSEVFILYVSAPEGQPFSGEAAHEALRALGLRYGLNDMYHRVTETHGVTESVFAVANMVKPGTLDPADADSLSSPGFAMFLLVPGPLEGRVAMHDMMETAHRLTQRLGGTVLDDKRALLKAQTAQFMLDQIAEIERRARIAQRR